MRFVLLFAVCLLFASVIANSTDETAVDEGARN